MSRLLTNLRAHYGSARCGLAYSAAVVLLIVVGAGALLALGAALLTDVPA
jgi:hypothetical protein